MIKNLVFDMGNVLIHWKGDMLLDWMGVENAEDRKLLNEKMFRSSVWPLIDWGTYREEEAEEIFRTVLPERLWGYIHHSLFWYDMIHPVEGMGDYVREKKKEGYGIYLLSNAPALVHEYFHLIPGSECFDGIVFSGEVKMVKPMPEIFHLLLDRYGLRAEECLFVDDLPLNVAGAVHEGMKGVVFHGEAAEIEKYLKSLGN